MRHAAGVTVLHRALALLLLLLAGCGVHPSVPVHYAGLGANRALPVLVQIEEREGDVVIAQNAGDDVAVDAGLAAVEARWAPFWTAWGTFVAAQHAWANAVERGTDAATIEAAARTAIAVFCAARGALPAGVPVEVLTVAEIACAP